MDSLPRELQTERLRLRLWTNADREPFAKLNADPRVMEYFAALLSREQSDGMAQRIEAHFQEHGFGYWAIEVPGLTDFAGYVGLSVQTFAAPFAPCVEISWRLAFEHWGRGYATEGARAVMRFGFDTVGLDEVVSFTLPANLRSRHVMEKIGMQYDPDGDFEHPNLPEGHPLRRHVLYRARNAAPPNPAFKLPKLRTSL